VIQEIKNSLSPYEEIVDSADADRLYFLKQHTLVTELIFDETQASYRIKGFKKL
ncbi:MAG: GTPase HflX, partial [Klebsiella sp.]|nr:GTPase HflX [Klebsiella sp.]